MNVPDRAAISLPSPESPARSAALAWSIAGLLLLLTSSPLPFVTAAKFGQGNAERMASGVISLWAQDQVLLAALVALGGFVLPLVMLVLLVGANLPGVAAAPRWSGAICPARDSSTFLP